MVVGIDFGQQLIEFNAESYRDGGLRGWIVSGIEQWVWRVMRGFTWGVTGLDRVWYQVMGTRCHKTWIRFGSG